MTDLEILQRAKTYIDQMANGIDPITGKEAGETDVINNVRISRCLFYVSDILRQVIENGGVLSKPKKKKEPFRLTDAQLEKFRYSEEPISVSEITKRFNELADGGEHVQLKYTQLTAWLIENGMLQETALADGKTAKRPTAHGAEIGIITEQRSGQYGTYTVVLYNKEAQRFIADHLAAILAEKEPQQNQTPETPEASGQPWTKEEEDRLIDLYVDQVPIPDIAFTVKRTEGGVISRLKKLGLMD